METLPVDLRRKVQSCIDKYPESSNVFAALIDHFSANASTEPASKRKAAGNKQEDKISGEVSSIESLAGTNIMLQLPDLSVQSPFRKKLNLVFGAFPNEKRAYLALTKSMETKPELLLKDLTNTNVHFAAILDVPEKPNLKQLLVTYKTNDGKRFKNDPILLQLPYNQLSEQFGPILGDKNLVEYLCHQLSLVNFTVMDGTKNKDIFYCQAYRGNKEGYLYFLENHLIFGFKKPISVLESKHIESITYTSITRLTFNMLLNIKNSEGQTETFEFSMIDQKDFEPIDIYKRSQQFNDRSMADELKAQKQLKNNNETPGDLVEAAKLVPGGDQIIGGDEEDDEEDDANYQIGDSDDDHSDASDEEGEAAAEEDDEEDDDSDVGEDQDAEIAIPSSVTPGFDNISSVGSNFTAFDEDLQQELHDLQRDLDFDINELQSAGYMNM